MYIFKTMVYGGINFNLVGKVICTKHAVPLLKNSKSASIVNIASRLGTRPCVETSAYFTIKIGRYNSERRINM